MKKLIALCLIVTVSFVGSLYSMMSEKERRESMEQVAQEKEKKKAQEMRGRLPAKIMAQQKVEAAVKALAASNRGYKIQDAIKSKLAKDELVEVVPSGNNSGLKITVKTEGQWGTSKIEKFIKSLLIENKKLTENEKLFSGDDVICFCEKGSDSFCVEYYKEPLTIITRMDGIRQVLEDKLKKDTLDETVDTLLVALDEASVGSDMSLKIILQTKGKWNTEEQVEPFVESFIELLLTDYKRLFSNGDSMYFYEKGSEDPYHESDYFGAYLMPTISFTKPLAILASAGLLLGAAYLYQNPEVAEKLQQRSLELYGQHIAPFFAAAREGFGGYMQKFGETVGGYWPFKK